MDKLLSFLKTLTPDEQIALCIRCGTTLNYIRVAASRGQQLGEKRCINFEREIALLGGDVICEDLRPDVDWAYLRGTEKIVSNRQEQRVKKTVTPKAVVCTAAEVA